MIRYLLTLLILAGLCLSANDTFGQLFRRTGCRPVIQPIDNGAEQRITQQQVQIMMFGTMHQRFNLVDAKLDQIQADTSWIRGRIEADAQSALMRAIIERGGGATIQPAPTPQAMPVPVPIPQAIIVPSSGGGISPAAGNTIPARGFRLSPVTSLAPRQ